jgi:hypothetical protein
MMVACLDGVQTRVVACQTCSNHVHEECFKTWAMQKQSLHQGVTCVYCRSAWPESDPASGTAGSDGNYTNLLAVSLVIFPSLVFCWD